MDVLLLIRGCFGRVCIWIFVGFRGLMCWFILLLLDCLDFVAASGLFWLLCLTYLVTCWCLFVMTAS